MLDACGFVATDMRRVIVPLGGSNVPFDRDAHSAATLDFVLADPDALSYQYVIECRRQSEAGDAVDVLAPLDWAWPEHRCTDELTALRTDVAQLRAQVDAWENSTLAKLTKPVRAMSGKLRRRLAR